MLIATGAAIAGLATVPALSASAAPVPAKAAAVSRTPRTASQQPAYVPTRHIRRGTPATAAGMPPTAQALYAVVNSNGTLARDFQAADAEELAPGIYQVDFNENITGCAYLATIGLTGSSGVSPPGMITVVGRAGDPDGVFVETFNSAGAITALSFHLGILC
jgi:hypothetical protein